MNNRPARKIINAVLTILMIVVAAGCKYQHVEKAPTSEAMRILQEAGCGERTIAAFEKLKISESDAREVATMRNAGVADLSAIRILELDRRKNAAFRLGHDIAELRNAGVSDLAVIDLVELGAIPAWTGDIVTMRSAGVSDRAVGRLAAIRFKVGNSISGSDVAELKHAGYSEEGLIDLAEVPIVSANIDAIVRLRYAGRTEHEILKQVKAHTLE